MLTNSCIIFRYDSGRSWGGEGTIERRMMCFSGSEEPEDVMEIKVYRAKGRQRIKPQLQDYDDVVPSMKANDNVPRSRLNGINGIR